MTATFDDTVRKAVNDMQISIGFEYIPAVTNKAVTTVEGLEEYYLMIPDHIKFVYFVYFMVHSSRTECLIGL